MTNIENSGSGVDVHGDVRSINDGGLQVLLGPRKDVVGVYDLAQGIHRNCMRHSSRVIGQLLFIQ